MHCSSHFFPTFNCFLDCWDPINRDSHLVFENTPIGSWEMRQSLKNLKHKWQIRCFGTRFYLFSYFLDFLRNFSLKPLKMGKKNLVGTLGVLKVINLDHSESLFAKKWSNRVFKVRGMNWSIASLRTFFPSSNWVKYKNWLLWLV